MKITNTVLAHDSFTQYGGAERVFEAIHEMYPESPVYTLVRDAAIDRYISSWNIRTSPLQFVYNVYPKFQHLFMLIPASLKFWKPKSGKLLLSSSSSFIKALGKPSGAVHINYCHTPTRFLWVDPQHAYKEVPAFLHFILKPMLDWLKKWDLNAAKKVDFFIANSKEVQQRIKKIYGRDSEIIYPFVDTDFWKPAIEKKDYFLIAGRLQYAKGLEEVVKAFNELGWPLHVAGTGRYEQHLKSIAQANIKFLGRVSDEELRNQYSGARGYIYPQFEDFGIMPLEAAACGTATIGLAKGGSLETIVPGKTGELLESTDSNSLMVALRGWDERKYMQEDLTAHAANFSKEQFKKNLSEFIAKHTNV